MTKNDELLEERLGYKFCNPALLERALTHSSAIPELRAGRGDTDVSPQEQDNEQLEFLGDAVLDMLASEYLLEAFSDWSEGHLSKSRARVVNARALETAARRLQLGEHLRLGRGEEKTGGREKPALLADAFEAVVAALYLDGGLPAARQMLRRVLFDHAVEERGEEIAAAGRKNVIGKPILYKTTKEFLIQFGLKDLTELPSLKEFEEIRRMAFAEAEPVGEAPAAEPAGGAEEVEPPEQPVAVAEEVPEPVEEHKS